MDGVNACENNELDWRLPGPDRELIDGMTALNSEANVGEAWYPTAIRMIQFWSGVEKEANAPYADRALTRVVNQQSN